ncbi:hypothetical protein ACQP1W_23660 [Spirillospora sp. CA-255316]
MRSEYVAAFAVAGEETENLIVVAERNRRVPIRRLHPREVADVVRAAVKHHHDVRVHELVLIEPGGLPRTGSGKISRTACREAYLDGTLPPHPRRPAPRRLRPAPPDGDRRAPSGGVDCASAGRRGDPVIGTVERVLVRCSLQDKGSR